MDKQSMVKILLPDYIDGTAKLPPSYEKLGIFNIFQRVAPEVENIELKKSEMLNIPESVARLLENLAGETVLRNTVRIFLRTWRGYISEDKAVNNYIFSKNLTKAFTRSALDVKCDALPESFNGYLHLPDVDCGKDYHNAKLIGAFVSLGFGRLTVLAFGQLGSAVSPVYFQYDLEEGKTVEEVIKDFKGGVNEAPDFLKVILTAVIYVTHSPEDLVEKINEFPRSEKKSNNLKKHYTQRKYVLVGQYYTLPKTYSDDWITNKGYFGFRWTGVGRSKLELRWISPSKPYKKGASNGS